MRLRGEDIVRVRVDVSLVVLGWGGVVGCCWLEVKVSGGRVCVGVCPLWKYVSGAVLLKREGRGVERGREEGRKKEKEKSSEGENK